MCYMAYAMGRMRCIWGEDAGEFRPERWLENGVFQPESPFKFTAFQVCSHFSNYIYHTLLDSSILYIYIYIVTRKKYFLIIFQCQAGPRICLGKEFAYRQLKILAAVLVNFFKFKLVDERKEARYRTMFTLHMDQGLHLYAFPRL